MDRHKPRLQVVLRDDSPSRNGVVAHDMEKSWDVDPSSISALPLWIPVCHFSSSSYHVEMLKQKQALVLYFAAAVALSSSSGTSPRHDDQVLDQRLGQRYRPTGRTAPF